MVAFLVCSWGCGSDQVRTYLVSGTVRFADGEPVRTGTVELESEEYGTTATGSIREDGTFVLGTYTENDGAAAGKHRAIVLQIIIADGITRHSIDHGRTVPPIYADYDSSSLVVEVKKQPQNDVVITLNVPERSN